MKIRRSVPFFRQMRRSAKIFVQIRSHNLIRNQKYKGSKVDWYMWMPLLISPICKEGNMLDDKNTVQRYSSNNPFAPELKWTSFAKRNNLDEFIKIPTKAEERFVEDQRSDHKTGTIRNPRQNLQLIQDPLCFQNPPIRSIYRKNPQSVRFLRPHPSIRNPIHPLLRRICKRSDQKKIERLANNDADTK